MVPMRRAASGRILGAALLGAALLGAAYATTALAQVATLATPGPEADASQPPAVSSDGQEGVLRFVACLREEGIDVPDPRFGLDGTILADAAAFAALDVRSPEFLDAVEACDDILAALQPELDAEALAERNEELLAFAQCMRREGVDFPDPDPLRGLTVASFRGEDGRLTIDPFSADVLSASSVCRTEVGLQLLPSPSP
jgi:hypothetical protein